MADMLVEMNDRGRASDDMLAAFKGTHFVAD